MQILMHELDPVAMLPFYRGKHFVSSAHTSEVSGIAALAPGAMLDDLVFNPCGYSANGLLGASYYTIHVTPQPYCSFASFETNLPLARDPSLLQRVLAVFRPRRFQVTLLANTHARRAADDASWETATAAVTANTDTVKVAAGGFDRTDHAVVQLQEYRLTFAQYVQRA
jgi:acetolactate synthase regulatory subunit